MIRSRHPQVEILILDAQSGKDGVCGGSYICSDSGELFRVLQNSGEPRLPMELPEPTQLRLRLASASQQDEVEPLPGMIGDSP